MNTVIMALIAAILFVLGNGSIFTFQKQGIEDSMLEAIILLGIPADVGIAHHNYKKGRAYP